jgi:hypothetical protein
MKEASKGYSKRTGLCKQARPASQPAHPELSLMSKQETGWAGCVLLTTKTKTKTKNPLRLRLRK